MPTGNPWQAGYVKQKERPTIIHDRPKRPIASVLTAAALFFAGTAARAQLNEFWVGPLPNTNRLGTLAQPFDGSTMSNFDYTMNHLTTNCVVHLLPGLYVTSGSGSWQVQPGQKIIGAGIGVTTVQLTSTAQDKSGVIDNNADVPASQMEVQDLTIDCNYHESQNRGPMSLGGLSLLGDHITVRRVQVINAIGMSPQNGNPESFTLAISPQASNSSGNLIEECEVSQFHGGSISGINVGGRADYWISAIVRNNRVLFDPPNAQVPSPFVEQTSAINGSWVRDYVVEGNYVQSSSTAAYSDTGTFTNYVISHNIFKNVGLGVFIRRFRRADIRVAYNTIELTNAVGGQPQGVRFEDTTNASVIGNTIMFDVGYAPNNPPQRGNVLNLFDSYGIYMAENHFDTNLFPPMWDNLTSNVTFIKNFDLEGNAMPDVLLRASVKATSFTNFARANPVFDGAVNITGGNPQPGDVLVSDAKGDATWSPITPALAQGAPPPYNEQTLTGPLVLKLTNYASIEHLTASGGNQIVQLPPVPTNSPLTKLTQILVQNAGAANEIIVENGNGNQLAILPPGWFTYATAQSSSWDLETFAKNRPFTMSVAGISSVVGHNTVNVLTVPPGMSFITTGVKIQTTAKAGKATAGAQICLGASIASNNIVGLTRLSTTAAANTVQILNPMENATVLTNNSTLTLCVAQPATGAKGLSQTFTADITGYYR